MIFDDTIFFFLNGLANRSFVSDALIIFFAEYLPYLLIIIFMGFILLWTYPRREKIHIAIIAGISTVIARFGVTELIRFFYHRQRPFMAYPQQVHQLIPESAWSFPSGHATFFFALAIGVWFYNKKWGGGLFLATTAMTTARIVAGVHYPSDVLGGTAIWALVACVAYYNVRQWNQARHTPL